MHRAAGLVEPEVAGKVGLGLLASHWYTLVHTLVHWYTGTHWLHHTTTSPLVHCCIIWASEHNLHRRNI